MAGASRNQPANISLDRGCIKPDLNVGDAINSNAIEGRGRSFRSFRHVKIVFPLKGQHRGLTNLLQFYTGKSDMKYKFNKSSPEPAKNESGEKVKCQDARDVFKKLLVTTSELVGFPRNDLSELAIQDGVILTQRFLKVSNPQARRLIIDLVEIIAALSNSR